MRHGNGTIFVRNLGQPITPVVREFYANATESNDFIVKVRGVKVSYSVAAINEYYELPNIDNDDYIQSKSNLDPDAILKVVGNPGVDWRFNENPLQLTMESKFMNHQMKAWHRFVGAKLLPTKHFATIDIQCANLIRSIESHDTIDVG